MDTSADHPATPAEKLISRTIQGTWIFYALGAQYLVSPIVAWTLAGMAAWRLYIAPALPAERRPPPLPGVVLTWLLGMLGMLVVLVVGHLTNNLGTGQMLKSAAGWAKGWALLALFPFAGAVLEVRTAVIYRAVCRLAVQTLCLMPLFLVAPFVGLPGLLYVSPLQVFGGSGPEYFAVVFYTIDPEFGIPRWQFMAPWSPAAGMVAVVHILCAIQERDWRYKTAGILAGLFIAYFSQSRLALVNIAVVWPLAIVVSLANRPRTWFAIAPIVSALLLLGQEVNDLINTAVERFKGARADSSRVRAALGRIAVDRWQLEAPWFGHGIVERGPHMVEYMPIGSHHSWYGLLFVKGILGVFSLAIPLAVSTVSMAWRAMGSKDARTAFAMLLVIWLYSFGENLEVLGYLYWPALVIVGIATKPWPFEPPAPASDAQEIAPA